MLSFQPEKAKIGITASCSALVGHFSFCPTTVAENQGSAEEIQDID